MSNTNVTTLYIVRHAESVRNALFAQGEYHAENNTLGSDLSELGKKQALSLIAVLKNIHFDAIFSSPLLRAKSTADIIASEKKLAVKTMDALLERKRGNLNGKTEEELRKEVTHFFGNPQLLSHEEMMTWKLFDDMESAEEAVNRLITALREIAIAYPGKTILVISHGNIMRTLLVHLGYGSFKELGGGAIENTGYIKLETDGIDFFVKETYNINKRSI